VPDEASDRDPEGDRYRMLHARLHEAVLAVVRASEGEVRILE
jgi:hypothetical protein